MSYRVGKFVADTVWLVHFIVVGLGIAMLPIALVFPELRTTLALCAGGLLVVWVVLRECPLRTIEHKLRQRFHPEGAHGNTFVYHNVLRPIGIPKHIANHVTFAYVMCVVVIALIT